MKIKSILLSTVIMALGASSCTIIRPGHAGVKQRLGKLSSEVQSPGPVIYNPLITKVIKTSVQTKNLELSISLPSKEGMSVTSQISILYRLNQEQIIANVFRSASADVCAQYFAKDMHSGMRAKIEEAIRAKMEENLLHQGINVEAVLMKSIQLPAGLASSIEQKLQAEQDAMRMQFVLEQSKLEAERKIINAKGERDAQKILAEGLTEEILRLRSIEAFENLSRSPNSKVIITDGKAPLLIDSQK
jgi:prohibitin 1